MFIQCSRTLCLSISFIKRETIFSMTSQGFFASPMELFVCSVLSVQCSNFYQKCTIDQNTHSLFSLSCSLPPKLKVSSFYGNPLDWRECSNMFVATVHNRFMPKSEKISHLKSVWTGMAKSAIASCELHGKAWVSMERRFGRP